MSWVDAVIIASVGLALWSGFARGALLQVFSWGGFIVGLIIGSLVAPPLVDAIGGDNASTKAFLSLGLFLGVAFLIEALVAAVGIQVRRKIVRPGAKKTDQVLGAFIAVFFALVASWFLGSTLQRGPSKEVASAVKKSAILRGLDSIFPQPPAILAEIGRFLDKTGFPDVFAQLNPSLAPGIEPAPASIARNPAILAAAEGTYKIESRGCGGVVDGSGFPLDERNVITASHVVAGTSGTRIIDPQGASIRGVVVYIDTEKDIAVIHLVSTPSHVLGITLRPAVRGQNGAAIGYPGGGPRKISPAAVRAKVNATGRDIYSRKLVTRQVYVLNAEVRQGNSGGPFVDESGVVRGMIFAASAEDPNESYALTADEIEKAYNAAKNRTQPVSTGECAL